MGHHIRWSSSPPQGPRDFSAGTCKAASDLQWDSVSSSFSCSCAPWSSVGEHEVSATSVGTLGQLAPPEPHRGGEQGTESPWSHRQPKGQGSSRGGEGSCREPHCPGTHLAGFLCALSSGHQAVPSAPALFSFPPGKQLDEKSQCKGCRASLLWASSPFIRLILLPKMGEPSMCQGRPGW